MAGWGLWAGTLRRCVWPSEVVLDGRIALNAGDCKSCLTPLTAGGEPAVLVCAAERATIADAPLVPVKGFDGTGVPACGEARADLGPCILFMT